MTASPSDLDLSNTKLMTSDINYVFGIIAIVAFVVTVILMIVGTILEKKGYRTDFLLVAFIFSVGAVVVPGFFLFANAMVIINPDGKSEIVQKWANDNYMVDITESEAQEIYANRMPWSEKLVGTEIINPYGEKLSVVLVQDEETEKWRLIDISQEVQLNIN